MSALRIVVAVVLFLVGMVWLGQGVGFIGGSAMTGSSFWAVVGAALVVIAAWLAVSGLRGRRAATTDDEP